MGGNARKSEGRRETMRKRPRGIRFPSSHQPEQLEKGGEQRWPFSCDMSHRCSLDLEVAARWSSSASKARGVREFR